MKNMQNNGKIVAGLIVLVLIAGSFYAGIRYDQSKSAGSTNQSSRGGQSSGQRNLRTNNGGGAVSGSVISVDDKSVTVKLRNGGSQIVLLSGTTQILKSVAGALSDLSKDLNVTVVGRTNPDGSITAESVQIRPSGIMGVYNSRDRSTQSQTNGQ